MFAFEERNAMADGSKLYIYMVTFNCRFKKCLMDYYLKKKKQNWIKMDKKWVRQFFFSHHYRRARIRLHDVSLHYVHPLGVKRLQEAVDDEHKLGHGLVVPDGGEAAVGVCIGQVGRNDLAAGTVSQEEHELWLDAVATLGHANHVEWGRVRKRHVV
jgi:hypothetical protein